MALVVATFTGCQQTSTPKRIQVEGHRGARWVLPENTIPAMRHAIEVGADVVELDLWVTKDDVLVLSHDGRLNPAFCEGPEGLPRVVRELTLAEVKQYDCGAKANPDFPEQKAIPGTRVPTLEELFEELADVPHVQYNVELKTSHDHPDWYPAPEVYAQLAVDTIRKHKMEKRVKIQSFDFRMLHAVKAIAPEIRLSALIGSGDESFVETSKRAGDAPTVSPNFRLVTPEKVREAHAAGLKIVAWTPNKLEDWKPLVEADVDAIITDHPGELVRYLKEIGRH